MTPQAETESLRFAERLPGWQRWSGSLIFAILAVIFAVVAVIESLWGFYLVAVALIFAVMWCWRLARITVTVDDQAVILTGPAWKRVVPLQDVHEVSVSTDNGMNLGLVNWPVTTHEHGSLTRLNMGGTAAVTFSDSKGYRYQFVLANLQDARLVAEAITG
ncbi:hypothetical protein ACTXJG_17060 [Glutamicibacter arilaitensis]|uniref:hypothetical protein n=1 Tax=Micrococcaceae TaxID=1268 RepID=UPI00105F1CDE|nr:hypothetical protein [Arthrobacter sp. JUb115]TDU30384.1 hypothetical protein EDF61_101343 [Arthrobacter sp. JUb115]